MEFWNKMFDFHEDNMSWKAVLLFVELCFCAPVSNATLERLFNHMNLVKTTLWNRLSVNSLNSILQICISGISMQTFHYVYVDKCSLSNSHWQAVIAEVYWKKALSCWKKSCWCPFCVTSRYLDKCKHPEKCKQFY